MVMAWFVVPTCATTALCSLYDPQTRVDDFSDMEYTVDNNCNNNEMTMGDDSDDVHVGIPVWRSELCCNRRINLLVIFKKSSQLGLVPLLVVGLTLPPAITTAVVVDVGRRLVYHNGLEKKSGYASGGRHCFFGTGRRKGVSNVCAQN